MITDQQRREALDRLLSGDVESAIGNCHHPGLHSLVLNTRPDGSLLRVFLATPMHTMDRLFTTDGHFTVGPHNHDKPLEFRVLFGDVFHVRVESSFGGTVSLWRYPFGSALEGGKFSLGYPVQVDGMRMYVEPLDRTALGTKDVHTVLVASKWAAWLVSEGKQEPVHKFIYSPRWDLNVGKLGDRLLMYQRLSREEIVHLCGCIPREVVQQTSVGAER